MSTLMARVAPLGLADSCSTTFRHIQTSYTFQFSTRKIQMYSVAVATFPLRPAGAPHSGWPAATRRMSNASEGETFWPATCACDCNCGCGCDL